MDLTRKFDFVVVGCGGRGRGFANWVKQHPDVGRIVAVADPDPERRQAFIEAFDVPEDRAFDGWQALAQQPRLGDVVINATMDRVHAASAVALLDLGYHMMLEKPMGVTLEECVAIDEARKRNNRIVAICHSLRYHRAFRKLKQVLASGAIGRLVSFDLIERVDHIHQSHSFVRGNWANSERSSFMLLAKSCHDLDVLAWLVDRPCLRVSSFGALTFFHEGNAPAGAPERCVDGCPVETSCVYSAMRNYFTPKGPWHWGSDFANQPEDVRLKLLHTSPFGRCVYRCDNDVVDHQVVSFEFEDQITGTFTMTAFTPGGGRRFRFHGTTGYIEAWLDRNEIEVWSFTEETSQVIKVAEQAGGHGGGDSNVMVELVDALRRDDPSRVQTPTDVSLASHKIVFAAEQARLEKRVVELAELESTPSPARA